MSCDASLIDQCRSNTPFARARAFVGLARAVPANPRNVDHNHGRAANYFLERDGNIVLGVIVGLPQRQVRFEAIVELAQFGRGLVRAHIQKLRPPQSFPFLQVNQYADGRISKLRVARIQPDRSAVLHEVAGRDSNP